MNEPRVSLRGLQLQKIVRNHSLCLDWMVVLLISDQISCGLLCVLKLLELDLQDLIQPFEILSHVINVASPLQIKIKSV
jgi:hypothetical protein